MALEGSPADVAPGSAGASVSPAVLRDAIKDSLLEVLRENPSLLRPPRGRREAQWYGPGSQGQHAWAGSVVTFCPEVRVGNM